MELSPVSLIVSFPSQRGSHVRLLLITKNISIAGLIRIFWGV